MTQAFNLSQLANNLNTSGQLDATDGLTGAVPVANGGTGLTATPTNGQIDIGNGSGFTRTTITAGSGISVTNGSGTITIATSGGGGVTSLNGQTGAITNTDFGVIGSYAVLMNSTTSDLGLGSTRAGSSLRYGTGVSTGYSPNATQSRFNGYNTNSVGGSAPSGTWRKVCDSQVYRPSKSINYFGAGLFVRIS